MWKLYALLSALFAALTAIFAKIGVKDIDSNLATAIHKHYLTADMGHRICFGPSLRGKDGAALHLDIPHLVRTCHGIVLAVIFQGDTAWRRIAGGAD